MEQGEVGWANVWKTQGGAVPSITDIYIFFVPNLTRVVFDQTDPSDEPGGCGCCVPQPDPHAPPPLHGALGSAGL